MDAVSEHEKQSKQLGVAAYNTLTKQTIVADGFKELGRLIPNADASLIRGRIRQGNPSHWADGWHFFSYRHLGLFLETWNSVVKAKPSTQYLKSSDFTESRPVFMTANSSTLPETAGTHPSNCWKLLVY